MSGTDYGASVQILVLCRQPKTIRIKNKLMFMRKEAEFVSLNEFFNGFFRSQYTA